MCASIIRCYLKWLLTSESNALQLSPFFSFLFFLVCIKTNILQLQHKKNGAKNVNWKCAEWMRMTWQTRIRFVGHIDDEYTTSVGYIWLLFKPSSCWTVDTRMSTSSERAEKKIIQDEHHFHSSFKKAIKSNPSHECVYEYETNGYQASNHVIAYVLMQMVQSAQRAAP